MNTSQETVQDLLQAMDVYLSNPRNEEHLDELVKHMDFPQNFPVLLDFELKSVVGFENSRSEQIPSRQSIKRYRGDKHVTGRGKIKNHKCILCNIFCISQPMLERHYKSRIHMEKLTQYYHHVQFVHVQQHHHGQVDNDQHYQNAQNVHYS